MNIISIKFYQLPYNYLSSDRFYKKENQPVELPDPILEITDDINSTLSFKIDTFLTSTLNIGGDINFNYIEISTESNGKVEVSFWFVMTNELIKPNYNKLKLRKDILTSYELIKNSSLNEVIKIGRKLFNNFNINNDNTISYKNERNPHIWNNNEVNQVIPQVKEIAPFSLTEILEPTNDKFLNGNFKFKVPEKLKDHKVILDIPIQRFSGYYDSRGDRHISEISSISHEPFQMYLSPFLTLLNEIISTTNFKNKGSQLSHLATLNLEYVNENLDVYSATSQAPVIYNSIFPIKPEVWFKIHLDQDYDSAGNARVTPDDFRTNILKDNDDWVNKFNQFLGEGNIFTCPWNKTIDITSINFMVMFKYVLGGFYLNGIDKITATLDLNLKSVDAYTSWLTGIIETIDLENDEINLFDIFPNTLKTPSYLDPNPHNRGTIIFNPPSLPHILNKSLSSINQDKFNYDLNKQVILSVNDDIFIEWGIYKFLKPQLFAQQYNYNYIDLIGNQLPLDNFKIYQSSRLLVQSWIGTGEQNISYYQGDIDTNGKILEPRYVNKFALAQPIEFNIDQAAINYQLRKNQLDAKVAETQLSQNREVKYISELSESKIALGNSQIEIQRAKNLSDTELKNTLNTDTKDTGRSLGIISQTINKVGQGLATGAFAGGTKAGGAGALIGSIVGLATSAIDAFNDFAKTKELVAKGNELTGNLTSNINTSLSKAQAKMNTSYILERNANIARYNSSAQSQLQLLEGEIADIKNIPNQTMNVSNITKMLSIEKGEISIISESMNLVQQGEMFKFWNKHGIKNWKSILTRNNWFMEFALFDYFQGGEWTKYLNNIGIFNIEIINEFNILMANGLRLHHQDIVYDRLTNLGLATSRQDINHNIPNWPKEITDLLE